MKQIIANEAASNINYVLSKLHEFYVLLKPKMFVMLRVYYTTYSNVSISVSRVVAQN